ncbi:hypothetical protein RYX36_017214 [Vicia faba]
MSLRRILLDVRDSFGSLSRRSFDVKLTGHHHRGKSHGSVQDLPDLNSSLWYEPILKPAFKMANSFFFSLLVFFLAALMLAPQGFTDGYKLPPSNKKPIDEKTSTSCTTDPTRPCSPFYGRGPPYGNHHPPAED